MRTAARQAVLIVVARRSFASETLPPRDHRSREIFALNPAHHGHACDMQQDEDEDGIRGVSVGIFYPPAPEKPDGDLHRTCQCRDAQHEQERGHHCKSSGIEAEIATCAPATDVAQEGGGSAEPGARPAEARMTRSDK